MWRLLGVSALALVMWSASCKNTTKGGETQKPTINPNELTVAFYNVENIFDIYDDPKTNDGDFTPSGKLAWSEDKYKVKLERISEAITFLDASLPDVIGLCEVENRQVVSDLASTINLASAGYGIVHIDSDDERGIDVALLYKQSEVEIISSENLKVMLPASGDKTRDILHVVAVSHGERIHFYVNHWPSRSGGQVESEPNRMAAASTLRKSMDKVISKEADAKIICMGDYNDHPNDKSITEGLGANGSEGAKYIDLMAPLHAEGKGSYWYKGSWGALDQFIVSAGLHAANSGWCYKSSSAKFLDDERIMFKDNKGIMRPNRTYVGDDYKAGFSDHLPIRMELIWK